MIKKQDDVLITTSEAACENIRRFEGELRRDPALAEIMAYARAWYALRQTNRIWALAPSKFVGYQGNSASAYLRTHRQRDGRLTEQALRSWFTEIDATEPVHDELLAALRELFARHGRTPNKRVRVNALNTDIGASPPRRRAGKIETSANSRVTVNPEVCGGRPCIRGMRIRVSDILELLASGAERNEILADYPYLEEPDIDAALEYAARSVDHRVIRAA